MFRFLRALVPLRQPILRPSPSLLRHDGNIQVQRVRFVRRVLTRRRLNFLLFSLAFGLLINNVDVTVTDEKENGDGRQIKITVGRDLGGESQRQEQNLGQVAHTVRKKYMAESGAELEEGTDADADDEIEDEDEDEDEDKDNDKDEDEDEDEEDLVPEIMPEDALFIPLGLAHQRPQTYYKGTDPEWQSFLEFAGDLKRSYQVRNDLAGLVGEHTALHPEMQKHLGAPILARKYWLDVDFPDGPPPEYERRGLEITEDYVAITTRPISTREFERLKRLLWPVSVARSLYASYLHLIILRLDKYQQFVNSKLPEDRRHKLLSEEQLRASEAVGFSELPPRIKEASGSEAGVVSHTEQPPKTKLDRVSSSPTRVFPPLPSLPETGEDFNLAFTTFKRVLAKTSKDPSLHGERGVCLVSGLVEVEGPKAVCVMDVRAFYHPGDSRWVAIAIGVRRMQAKQQYPRGEQET